MSREIIKRSTKLYVGINPLNEYTKHHDNWYRDNQKTEDRCEADKVLQMKAGGTVISADANLNVRFAWLTTASAM